MRGRCVERGREHALIGAALVLAASSTWASRADAQRAVPVHVESSPAGASVHLEWEAAPLGTTPLRDVRLPVGSHTLVLRLPNHEEARLAISVSRRGETFRVTLRPLAAIEVIAADETARGAEVRVDGEATAGVLGPSPLRVDGLTPGRHQVEVSREGHRPFSQWVSLASGEVAQVRARLEPVVAAAAAPPPPAPEAAPAVEAPAEQAPAEAPPAAPPPPSAAAPAAVRETSLGVLPSYVEGWTGRGRGDAGIPLLVAGGIFGAGALTLGLVGGAVLANGDPLGRLNRGDATPFALVLGGAGSGLVAIILWIVGGVILNDIPRASEAGVRFGALEITPNVGPAGASVVGRIAL